MKKKLSQDHERKLCLQCTLPDCLPGSRSCLIRIETGTLPRGAIFSDPAVRAKMSAASKRAWAEKKKAT
jgi:hypothetical protein